MHCNALHSRYDAHAAQPSNDWNCTVMIFKGVQWIENHCTVKNKTAFLHFALTDQTLHGIPAKKKTLLISCIVNWLTRGVQKTFAHYSNLQCTVPLYGRHCFFALLCSVFCTIMHYFAILCTVRRCFFAYYVPCCTEEDLSASLSMELVFDDCDLQKQNYLASNWHLQHCNANTYTIGLGEFGPKW